MRPLVLIAAFVLAAPAQAHCNPWAAEDRQACLDSNARELREEQQSEAQTQALQDIADQLQALRLLQAGRQ